MLEMMESGLMEHWRNKHLSVKDHCSGPNLYGAVLRKLTLNDFSSAFIIWFVDLCISLTAFLAENAVYFLIKFVATFQRSEQ